MRSNDSDLMLRLIVEHRPAHAVAVHGVGDAKAVLLHVLKHHTVQVFEQASFLLLLTP